MAHGGHPRINGETIAAVCTGDAPNNARLVAQIGRTGRTA
jgi:hypothetical protein